MDAFLELVLDPANGMRTVVALVAAKVVLAVIRSLKEGKFDSHLLPEYLRTDVLPYLGGLGVLFLLSSIDDKAIPPMYTASAAAVSLMLARQCWAHLAALFGVTPPER